MGITAEEAIRRMVPPGARKPGKYMEGVIQIWVTRNCDQACYHCTQASNIKGTSGFITPEQFEQACISLKDYFGVVGVFGGNPALHPQFAELCDILKKHIPYKRRGLWCNHPRGKGRIMAETFNPGVSNLNVHMSQEAYDEFKRDWPKSNPVGLTTDSRHSPPYVAIQDVIEDEGERWLLISDCDINKYWSAMVAVFRGELRAYFCEIAGAQAILHQNDPDYPDVGLPVEPGWWRLPMEAFQDQVKLCCQACGVPLRGYGELAVQGTGPEQVSATHASVYLPKKGREVQIVTSLEELNSKNLTFTRYLQGANK